MHLKTLTFYRYVYSDTYGLRSFRYYEYLLEIIYSLSNGNAQSLNCRYTKDFSYIYILPQITLMRNNIFFCGVKSFIFRERS